VNRRYRNENRTAQQGDLQTERELMSNDRFVYVTYIRTTAEDLWHALTDPETSRKYYFDSRQETSWKKGASWRMFTPDGRLINSGEVLEVQVPKRLALSWRNHLKPDLNAEGVSYATFELERQGTAMKLTLTHEIGRAHSRLIEDVAGGWPFILASLKTMLETGEPLDETRQWPRGL
jgi:uncharacterized protein YndB with AHSA1/START domain